MRSPYARSVLVLITLSIVLSACASAPLSTQPSERNETTAPITLPPRSVESPIILDWVAIPGGLLRLGGEGSAFEVDQSPRPTVQIEPFWLTRGEISVGEYTRCVEAGACRPPSTGEGCNWGRADRSDHPVNCVSWWQARRFSRWAGGDLPSEAEWELAARSGRLATPYPWGHTPPSCLHAVMNDGRSGCGQRGTWPRCSRPQGDSSHGLCDLVGNVQEWTLDEYHSSYRHLSGDGAPVCLMGSDCLTPKVWRVSRGGGWSYGPTLYLSSTTRNAASPQRQLSALGFRSCRRDPPQS